VTGPLGYPAISFGLVILVTAGLWPFLGSEARDGLLAAGGLALLTQMILYVGLHWLRQDPERFALTLILGIGVRMTVVFAAALLLVWPGILPAASFLLGLAGFLFALVLLESAFLKLTVYEQSRYAAES
jgi:hypothetical protein